MEMKRKPALNALAQRSFTTTWAIALLLLNSALETQALGTKPKVGYDHYTFNIDGVLWFYIHIENGRFHLNYFPDS